VRSFFAGRRLQHRWRGREDEFAVLHERHPTERIWYYDLSDVKVGKKSPLTLKHFEDFAAKLATRADSDRSWTVDLAARRAKATEEALPFRETHAARRAKRTGLGTYWQYSRKQSRGMMLQLVRPRFASS
jgi:hypothetical protein